MIQKKLEHYSILSYLNIETLCWLHKNIHEHQLQEYKESVFSIKIWNKRKINISIKYDFVPVLSLFIISISL